MFSKTVLARAASAVLVFSAGLASAQTYTPLAFGPVPGNLGGLYVTRINDISVDGSVVIGQLSDFTSFSSSPAGVTSLGFTTARYLSNDGQTIIGERFISSTNAPVVRWTLGSGVGTDLPIQAAQLTGINSDATQFLHNGRIRNAAGVVVSPAPVLPPPPPTWMTPFYMASRAPITAGLGGTEGAGYRYNYQTGTLLSNQAVPGLITTVATVSPLSGDGGVFVGTVSVSGGGPGNLPRPAWWDSNGVPHLLPMFTGATAGGLGVCVNDAGTLIGGNWGRPGGLDSAYVYSIALDQMIDIGQIFRDAGMVPAGWRLVATTHISDDGSRIFCTAVAPNGTTQAVMLNGIVNVPTPGAAGLLGLGGLLAARRRR